MRILERYTGPQSPNRGEMPRTESASHVDYGLGTESWSHGTGPEPEGSRGPQQSWSKPLKCGGGGMKVVRGLRLGIAERGSGLQ